MFGKQERKQKNWVKHELSIPSPFHKNSFKQIYIPKVKHYFSFRFLAGYLECEKDYILVLLDSNKHQQRICEFIQLGECCVHVISNGDCTPT